MKTLRILYIIFDIVFILVFGYYIATGFTSKKKVIPYNYEEQSKYQVVLGTGEVITVADLVHLVEECEYKLNAKGDDNM